MVDAGRARRMSARIKQIVASTIEMQVKDPRLGMVTITDVRLTGDLHDASIFYTVLGGNADYASSAAALQSATGLIRSQVGKQLGLKFTPTLVFIPDVVPESARQLDEALAAARELDARVAQASVGATYAGEPDPYKHDEPDEDEETPEAEVDGSAR